MEEKVCGSNVSLLLLLHELSQVPSLVIVVPERQHFDKVLTMKVKNKIMGRPPPVPAAHMIGHFISGSK